MAEISSLIKAKRGKKDEFYTQKWDVEQELSRYRESFTGKSILCNCDDTHSAFFHYFYRQFSFLKLKQLICVNYKIDGSSSYALLYKGGSDSDLEYKQGLTRILLNGNGDFRSDECVEFLKQSNVVVTNPPFSLFREFFAQLVKYHKQFVIWGNQNAINYKEVFPQLMHNKTWLGGITNQTCVFRIPNDYEKYDKKVTEEKNDGNHYGKVPSITTFTNLPVQRSTDQVVVFEGWDFEPHPAYDNYAAFEVSKVSDIPVPLEVTTDINSNRLDGWKRVYKNDLEVLSNNSKTAHVKIKRPILGVPITFMSKYNPSSILETHNLGKEFDILGISTGTNSPLSLNVDYSKYKGIKQNGELNGRTGSTFGNCPTICKNDGKHVYYQAPNGNTVQATYARIFIRVKPGVTKF